MLTVSKTKIRWILVAALAICILGVLILPQVDLPDFTFNANGSTVFSPDHVRSISFDRGGAGLILLNLPLLLYGFCTFGLVSILKNRNMSLELKKTATLRC
jgi:hypothetical protein